MEKSQCESAYFFLPETMTLGGGWGQNRSYDLQDKTRYCGWIFGLDYVRESRNWLSANKNSVWSTKT